MKKITLLFLLLGLAGMAQVTTVPNPTIATGPVTINFNKAGTPLADYNGIIYAHIGLSVDGEDWQYVKGTWGNNDTQPALTPVSGTNYKLELTPNLYTYFGVPTTSTITKIWIVLRAASGNPQTGNLSVNVGSFQVNLTAPAQNSTTLLNTGANFSIAANNTGGTATYNLMANGVSINTATATSSYSYTHTGLTGNQHYSLVVTQGTNVITKSFTVIVNQGTATAAMPAGLEDGINYTNDATKATLVLDAPGKDFVYVAGSFNNWQPVAAHAMKKDGATGKFWLELTGLTANNAYTYQYWVVDQTPLANSPIIVKTADPYSTLVLSEQDDAYIPAATYPGMPQYPVGQQREVTVLQTGQTPYAWQEQNFVKPVKDDLVIYEVLVRDFGPNRNYQDLIDRIDYFKNLNINAIQLMPVMEFEGNESWGYNTSFHMANDKFYGPGNKLKEFIDLCHQNGIAVILDVALNHAFGRNPMNRMWMIDPDGDGYGEPSSENPYFNTVAMHSYNVGSDFNHQQARTKNYVKRVIKHWIQEYNIDGFRWDLTKGFTQNCPGGNEACTNSYQQDRVDVLKEYADYSWSLDDTHYTIFEHLGQDNEEQQWANYRINEGKGIMMWGIMNNQYNQLSMGYPENANINRVGHTSRGFTGKRLIGYAESHDEERLMYKNLQHGNATNSAHNVKNLTTALSRMSAIGAVLLPGPGPKMIWHFGELGWDESIFTCNNGTVNLPGGTDGDCKLDTKQQPQWSENWMDIGQRQKIYYEWARMIALKQEERVFRGSYTINPATGNSLIQKIYIWDDALPATELKNVVILANFNVTPQNVVPDFPYTGTWYSLMDHSPFNVATTTAPITLQPGEFRIYGNQKSSLDNKDFNTTAIALYPNPATDAFAITTATSKVEVYAITGQLVKSFNGNGADYLYNVSDLNQGMYLVKITDSNQRQMTAKLIKK